MGTACAFDTSFAMLLASQIRFEELQEEKTASCIDQKALEFLMLLIRRPAIIENPTFLQLCEKSIQYLKYPSIPAEKSATVSLLYQTAVSIQRLAKVILIETNGQEGIDGIPGSHACIPGESGMDGQDGDIGFDAGDIHIQLSRKGDLIQLECAGEIVTWNEKESKYCLVIRANGGKGGNGGDGGSGAKGKNGKDGDDATEYSNSTQGEDGQDGGSGGNGGIGGSGGRGGHIVITTTKEDVDLLTLVEEVSYSGGEHGEGGVFGNGAKGGDGGDGGSSYSWTEYRSRTEYYYDSYSRTQNSRLVSESIPRFRPASSSGCDGSNGMDGYLGKKGIAGEEGKLTIVVDGVKYPSFKDVKDCIK